MVSCLSVKLVEPPNFSHAMFLKQHGGPNYFLTIHSVTWVHLLLLLLTIKFLLYTGVEVMFT